MTNQHAGLSQVLAEQRITERREQAAHWRLGRGAGSPLRRRRSRAARGWWQLARCPAVATQQLVRRPAQRHVIDRRHGVQTHPRPGTRGHLGSDEHGRHDRRRPGPSQQQGKDARQPPSERQVGEPWRHAQAVSQQQAAADAALRRVLARERSSIPSGTPQVTAPAPSEPSGQPGGLLASLGVLAAALALAGGLAVLATTRAGRRARARHAAGPRP
jgi:hypothetical protein